MKTLHHIQELLYIVSFYLCLTHSIQRLFNMLVLSLINLFRQPHVAHHVAKGVHDKHLHSPFSLYSEITTLLQYWGQYGNLKDFSAMTLFSVFYLCPMQAVYKTFPIHWLFAGRLDCHNF